MRTAVLSDHEVTRKHEKFFVPSILRAFVSLRAFVKKRGSSGHFYWFLNATTGSLEAARIAGSRLALVATTSISNTVPTNVTGSVGVTSNSRLAISRVSADE